MFFCWHPTTDAGVFRSPLYWQRRARVVCALIDRICPTACVLLVGSTRHSPPWLSRLRYALGYWLYVRPSSVRPLTFFGLHHKRSSLPASSQSSTIFVA